MSLLLHEKLEGIQLLLGSKSPRRNQLLGDLGLSFNQLELDVEEVFPEKLQRESIPLFLARQKADAGRILLLDKQILITADTIVWTGNEVLNKPLDENEAKRMLSKLSGKSHEVITAVCLCSTTKIHSFYTITEVVFKSLREEEIDYYISHYQPFDKAGAYGIQEWIGFVGVETIHGSYFNVVGLPVHELYEELLAF